MGKKLGDRSGMTRRFCLRGLKAFFEIGLNMPIHNRFLVCFCGLDPIDGTQYQKVYQKLNLWVMAVLAVYYDSSLVHKKLPGQDEKKNMNFWTF